MKTVSGFLSVLLVLNYSVFGNIIEQRNNRLRYNLVEGLPDIYITAQTEKIGHTWSHSIVWDKPLIQKFYSILPANDFFVVIDLGAQTGSFSLLAKYFPNSAWYAFEPIKEAIDVLKDNLKLNNIQNVAVFMVAVTDFSGKITLNMPAMNEWGLSTIGQNVLRFTPCIQREVECIDLDSFVEAKQIPKVHFMKLDTEGAEYFILSGARRMIMRDHPIMIMEYNEINMKQCGICKQDIDNLLAELGYEWRLISSEDILCVPIVD